MPFRLLLVYYDKIHAIGAIKRADIFFVGVFAVSSGILRKKTDTRTFNVAQCCPDEQNG